MPGQVGHDGKEKGKDTVGRKSCLLSEKNEKKTRFGVKRVF